MTICDAKGLGHRGKRPRYHDTYSDETPVEKRLSADQEAKINKIIAHNRGDDEPKSKRMQRIMRGRNLRQKRRYNNDAFPFMRPIYES